MFLPESVLKPYKMVENIGSQNITESGNAVEVTEYADTTFSAMKKK